MSSSPLEQSPFSHANEIATEFDQWAEVGRGDSMAEGHLYATKILLKDLAIAADSVVLDAGCGVGWILNDLIGADIAEGVGIDLSPEMVAIASSRKTLSHLEFLTADSTKTPFPDGQFSHIISVESLYYNAQPLDTLKEWRRISRVGGHLGLVIDLYQDNPAAKYWVEALSITAHNFSVVDWEKLLISAGWENITHRRVPLPVKISAQDFTPSAYFPTYEVYQAYCGAGSLLLRAKKAT
ncbi:class I SAM-dependent methyltransferase [[Limnothrix rosea] IAM M-220]|uniref:class I SAM-dependent methyltransferase n=1 Tax=[Limnothrix rosea] IAM M-220 TaxID=454133 RepID=UPI00096862C3|nr:class I SAM-dependent methyltransferase [[Limnothrix rosea] IAM M-220]OKH18562.1 ubiquinone/menaquinone biosynthesis protein [[Limnothrix rosea] IAM M-220]